MNTFSWFWSLILAASPFLAAEEGEPQIQLDWKYTFEEAGKEAKTANMPIFMEFVRAGNRDCQRMEKTLANLKVIQDLLDKCILCRLDADQKASIQVMNKFQINGMGMPFFALIGKDWKLKGSYGGYATAEEFLRIFGGPLTEALKERVKTPAEILRDNIDGCTQAQIDRRYAKAIGHILEVKKIARELQATSLSREADDNLREVIELGKGEIKKAKEKAEKTKNYAEAIAVLKRVQIEFEGREPATEAAAVLEAYKANPAVGGLVETTDAAPEGYEMPAPAKKEEEKKPKPSKKMVRIEMKDGKVLFGTVVTEDKKRVFFRPESKDPKDRNPRFIDRADMISLEPMVVEEAP